MEWCPYPVMDGCLQLNIWASFPHQNVPCVAENIPQFGEHWRWWVAEGFFVVDAPLSFLGSFPPEASSSDVHLHAAITQLFRLSSSTYTLPSGNPPSSSTPTSTASSSLSTPTVSTSDLPSVVANLLVMVQQQEQALSALGTSTNRERDRYHKLGKPIGGTFVMLGLLFLFLGESDEEVEASRSARLCRVHRASEADMTLHPNSCHSTLQARIATSQYNTISRARTTFHLHGAAYSSRPSSSAVCSSLPSPVCWSSSSSIVRGWRTLAVGLQEEAIP